MELKNIQRYTNTYISNILSKIKRILTDPEDIKFIDDMIVKNDSFTAIQNGRKEKDMHPILDFTPYELLVDFRNFMENYEKLLQDNNYKEYRRNLNIPNELYAKFDKFAKEMYYLSIIPNEGRSIDRYMQEKKIVRQIRNADAHGDIDVVIQKWIEDNILLRFGVNNRDIQRVEIRESDFQKMLKYLYSRVYNSIDIKDIFLLNKEETYELSSAIANEEELMSFLDKRSILTTSIKGTRNEFQEEKVDEITGWLTDSKEEKHEEKIMKILRLTDDRSCCTDKDINNRIRNIIGETDDFEVAEISEEDKNDILEFVRKQPRFFKERIDIQRNLIAEVLRKKYISKEVYDISRNTKKLSLNNETIQYFERKNTEYFEGDIERQFLILSKIVFLTNKEKLFDRTMDYTKLDISKADIKYIKSEEESTVEEQFFRRLRNSLTHYRYEILENGTEGLERKVRLWDKDGEEITFDAEMNLRDCIEIILEMDFLKEIDYKHKEDDDKILDFSIDEQEEFDCIEISRNPKQFQFLDLDKRNNKKIIEAAIIKDRSILLHVGEDIENDREYLKDILVRYPDAIIYLNKYKDDDEFVKIALSLDGFLIESVDDKYKQKEEYVLLALESAKSHMVLYDIPIDIIYEKEFIRKAILINPFSISVTSPKNKNDEELAMLAVKGNGLTITDISERLRGTKSIAIEAIKSNLCAKYHVPKELYDDPDFCAEVEKIEKETNSYTIKSEEIEELTEEVGVNAKEAAEQFMHNIENMGREEQKSE